MQVTLQIVCRLELAARIVQTAYHHVAEHFAWDRLEAYVIVKPSENQLWADNLYL